MAFAILVVFPLVYAAGVLVTVVMAARRGRQVLWWLGAALFLSPILAIPLLLSRERRG